MSRRSVNDWLVVAMRDSAHLLLAANVQSAMRIHHLPTVKACTRKRREHLRSDRLLKHLEDLLAGHRRESFRRRDS